MNQVRVVGLVLAGLALARPVAGQGIWTPVGCDLKSGHFKVNSAQLYLKSAYEKNSREKDLKDALKNLNEAITMNGQDKNAAAWYYLGRYYVAMTDLAGADTAFTRAEALAPQCKADIKYWRRFLWTAPYNVGVAAMNAGKTDSAIASFKRANLVYRTTPETFEVLGILYFNTHQFDSAAKYFQAAVQASTDTQFAAAKRRSSFNLAAAYQQGQHDTLAVGAFQAYLRDEPNDVQAIAGLASLYMSMGQKDSAQAMYKRLIQRADSVDPMALFDAGGRIYAGAPPFPDTAAIGLACRAREKGKKPSRPGMTAAQHQSEIAKTCNKETADSSKAHQELATGTYTVAAEAFHAVLKRIPQFRDALYNLTNVYFALDNSDSMLTVSRRLIAIDPLNRTSTRLHAQAWQLKAESLKDSAGAAATVKASKDSAYKYVLVAAESMAVEVTIDSFVPRQQDAGLYGHVTNFHEQGSSPALSIVVEFLSASSDVIGSQKVQVATQAPQGSQAFAVQLAGKNIVAYRYHKE